MVPVDFERTSALALEYAGELASRFDAALYVVHVVDDEFAMPGGTEGTLTSMPRLQHDVEASVLDQIREMIGQAEVEAHATPVALVAPATAEALVGWARSSNVDIIVMGTHGRGQAPSNAIGSVTDQVVRLAPCPVLVVRRPLHAIPESEAAVATRESQTSQYTR